ncbi:SCO family protein [uncultured Piscinibacter sp.]|uniref:SCO family protein n=1 Tax=uncultured Piscinibacter sp. TaxID=1131835 RepID=UPI002633E3A6|nr:SCO family protein [uncultured Piscinibacter sp.]
MTDRGAARLWRLRAPLALLAPHAGARAASDAATGPAPRGRVDASKLPAPGSYRLARIMKAPDGTVLDSDGRSHRLHRLLAGRLSVVSFMYTYCRDPEGCPKAWAAMDALHAALLRDPALAAVSQLVSLSFDPTNDTPQQMRQYGGERVADARVRWRFLTTASVPALLPLLDGFGQDVTVETDTRGRPTRTLNHMLKLFLVDEALQVREVYSVATLSHEAMVNDLRTLAMERAAARP